MKCPKELRHCPNGWNDCECCEHQRACIAGMYEPDNENDLEVVIKAAEISEAVVDAGAKESIHKVRGTWAEGFLNMSPEERMNEFYSFNTQGLNHKEPNPAGPSEPGGGSSMKCKKSNKGTKPTVYEWGMFR